MNHNEKENNDADRTAALPDPEESEIPELPELAPDTIEPEDVDIHGKLAHLNALDMSDLTLNRRHVMMTFIQPPYSDELGRFTTITGSYPRIPGLSSKEAQVAIEALKEKGLIKTWHKGGSTCGEVAGAYAYKPNLKRHLHERHKIAVQKRKEAAIRKQRKKDAEAGIPFAYDDDNKGMADDGETHDKLLTRRGNLVSNQKEFFYRSDVPHQKSQDKYKMILAQPDTIKGCILRMLPSFSPVEELSPLAAVIRFYLMMGCDDFGRVRVDVQQIHGQLGSAITKRVSKEQIRNELKSMQLSGHLILFKKPQGNFAYVRDTAQHLKAVKNYNRNIPKLYADREFTYDSKSYKAFFVACKQHSAERDKVRVAQYAQKGDVIVIHQYASEAAKQFVRDYEEFIRKEPFRSMPAEDFCGFEGYKLNCGPDIQFFHGFRCGLPAKLMERIYFSDQEVFDGTNGNPKTHRILTHAIGMEPRKYVESLKVRESDSSNPVDEDDQPPVVPEDDDDSATPDDEEAPPVVPSDDEVPPVVP